MLTKFQGKVGANGAALPRQQERAAYTGCVRCPDQESRGEGVRGLRAGCHTAGRGGGEAASVLRRAGSFTSSKLGLKLSTHVKAGATSFWVTFSTSQIKKGIFVYGL